METNTKHAPSNKYTLDTREMVAAWLSAGIALTALVYWVVQIKGVIEMLKLAYG